jgi:hypothetical protein
MDSHEYEMRWTGPDGEAPRPVKVPPHRVHTLARESVALAGGTARILRATRTGWREVARYTGAAPVLVLLGH